MSGTSQSTFHQQRITTHGVQGRRKQPKQFEEDKEVKEERDDVERKEK